MRESLLMTFQMPLKVLIRSKLSPALPSTINHLSARSRSPLKPKISKLIFLPLGDDKRAYVTLVLQMLRSGVRFKMRLPEEGHIAPLN